MTTLRDYVAVAGMSRLSAGSAATHSIAVHREREQLLLQSSWRNGMAERFGVDPARIRVWTVEDTTSKMVGAVRVRIRFDGVHMPQTWCDYAIRVEMDLNHLARLLRVHASSSSAIRAQYAALPAWQRVICSALMPASRARGAEAV